jgi:Uma2 family endonuclease
MATSVSIPVEEYLGTAYSPDREYVEDQLVERHVGEYYLAIEILSREDEPGETLTRVGDYLQSGTPYVWIVDPYKRTLVVADRDGIPDVPDLVVATDLVGTVDFNELFRQLDEPAE